MADSDKDILITPNTGAATDPSIVFSSGATGGDDVTLFVTDDGTITTLSIEGSAGQLFSVSNDLTGVIFSVNDISGIPSLEVNADGTVSIAEFDGDVGIGTSSPSAQLHVIADSATTNADIPVIRITSTSTGTPATGIGPSIEFESETAAGSPGNLEIGGVLALESTDVTATTEDFDFVFSTMAAGAAAAERMRITSTGNVTATSFGGITEANLVDKTAAETITGAWDFNAGATVLNGLDFGSVVGASATDLTEHIALWGSTYGFNVTSNTLNVTAAGTNTLSSTNSLITSRVAHDFDGNVTGSGSNTLSGFLSIEGITSANLVDKSANETITGTWTIDKIITGSNSVATETDILLTDNGNIGATQSMNFITDTDNTQTGTAFKWLTNAPGETSATTVMTLNENGNLVGVGTLTGFTSISAATIGGITEANLVDKTATETISGSWNYTAVPTVSGGKVVYDQGTLDGADFDLIDATNEEGIYTWTTTATNSPFNYGTLLAFHDSGQINQLAFGGAGFGQMSIRRRDSGTWYAWSDFVSVDQSHTPVNNRVATWVSATELDSSANLTFDGSTLNVTGTVAATTVTGANVTSGADPGHTHGAGSVPNHDSLNGFVANEHIDWTADSGSQIQVDNLAVDRSYAGVSTVTPQYSYVGYDRFSGGIDNDLILDAGIFGLASGDTNGAGNGTFNPMLVMRNSSDVRVQVSFPRENSNPIAYRGYHTAAWQTWHYAGWTTTEANANLDATFAKISGTPANNQIAVWTGTTDIEGTSTLTFDGATFSCTASTAHDFYSGAASSIARFGRNANENFRFDVTDGNSTITLDQDETDATSHQFLLNIESANTGARGFEFQDNGTMVMEIDFLNNQITTDGVDFAMTKLGSEGDTILKIEADSDNLVEASNAIVHLTQDGEAVHATFETQDAGNLIALTSGTTFAGRTTVMSWPYNSTAVTFAGSVQASSLTLSTALDEAEGGTGQTTYATGDILYASAANTLSKLAAGTNGHVLTLAAGVPSWAAPGGGGITGTVANDQIVVGTGASTVDSSANLTFNGSVLAMGSGTRITGTLNGDTGATSASISLTGQGTALNAGSYANWGRNYSSARTFMSNNTYVDSGDVVSDQHRYAVTHGSYGHTIYEQAAGAHYWYGDSASVTAGNIVTKQSLMTLTEAGNLTVLGNIYPGNQTLGYIRSVTGNYGSVQVTGADGSSGSYSGISVDGKLVMMTSGTTGGIYDDTNNTWKIRMDQTGAGVNLYYGSIEEFATQNSDAAGNTSGAYVKDHAQVTRDVGFNDLRRVSDNPASFTVDEQHMGGVIYADDNTAFTVTLPSSTSSFPVGGVITIINANSSAVNITVADQGTYTCFYLDPGGGRTDIAASATIARGGVATIWRAETGGVASTPCFLMWGSGITP